MDEYIDERPFQTKKPRQRPALKSRPLTPDELPKSATAKEKEYASGLVPNETPEPDDGIIVIRPDDATTITKTPRRRQGGITGRRVIELDQGTYELIRRDPYGFWYILGLAHDLGTFTGLKEAEQALMEYLRDRHEKGENA